MFKMAHKIAVVVLVMSVSGMIPAQAGGFFLGDSQTKERLFEGGGLISGTTYISDGSTPLPHIAVSLKDVNNTYSEMTCSDENGHYEFANVPFDLPLRIRADSYQDAWCNAGANYTPEYWGETLNDGPSLIEVNASFPEQRDKNFALDLAGSEPTPYVAAWLRGGIIEAFYWDHDTHLKLRIEDPNTSLSPDYFAEAEAADSGEFSLGVFDLNGKFELLPGMIVAVSGAYMTRIIVVDNLAITDIDMEEDTISGTTAPNNWMWMYFEPSCCRPIVANTSGAWTVDYSIEGPNGEPVADIVQGSTGAVHVPSGDGRTSLNWAAPDPYIGVWYLDSYVEALYWPVGTQLRLQIEDTATLIFPDFAMETKVTDPTLASFDLSGGLFEIKPGMIVIVSGSYITRKIVVDDLTISEIDLDSDTISGTTAPNNWMWMYFEDSCCRPIVANASGIWTVDYSVEGPNEEQAADIVLGSMGAIHVPGGDGRTSLFWSAAPPVVTSSERANGSPTYASSVEFTVTFSEAVKNVDKMDFVLSAPGVAGASISSVYGSGNKYTVSVNTGSGSGTIRLVIPATATIIDSSNNPLDGLPYEDGEFYEVNRTLVTTSTASHDGYILESTETSGTGGTQNNKATTFFLGDDTSNRQYRSILSFNTTLPSNAVITKVTLKLKYAGKAGTNPFSTHGNLLVDVRKGAFSNNNALQLGDFSAAASKANIGSIPKALSGGWYTKVWTSGIFDYINKSGVTQFRLRFAKDDNNDFGADYLKIYSGNAGGANGPQLIIEYYVP